MINDRLILMLFSSFICPQVKEGKRLKEFLEDYDDERDDPKYYRLTKSKTIPLYHMDDIA